MKKQKVKKGKKPAKRSLRLEHLGMWNMAALKGRGSVFEGTSLQTGDARIHTHLLTGWLASVDSRCLLLTHRNNGQNQSLRVFVKKLFSLSLFLVSLFLSGWSGRTKSTTQAAESVVTNALTMVQKNSKTKCWLEEDGGPILESRELWPSSHRQERVLIIQVEGSWPLRAPWKAAGGNLLTAFTHFLYVTRFTWLSRCLQMGHLQKYKEHISPSFIPKSLFHLEELYFSKCTSCEHLINEQGATDFITSIHLSLTQNNFQMF